MKWSNKRRFGNIGENVACVYLENHGFRVAERNYLRKWGEIDIVAIKSGVIHFVEVKSVSGVTSIRAEENMHPGKLKRLQRTAQTYLLERHLDQDWQIDLAVVTINEAERSAKVNFLDNIL